MSFEKPGAILRRPTDKRRVEVEEGVIEYDGAFDKAIDEFEDRLTEASLEELVDRGEYLLSELLKRRRDIGREYGLGIVYNDPGNPFYALDSQPYFEDDLDRDESEQGVYSGALNDFEIRKLGGRDAILTDFLRNAKEDIKNKKPLSPNEVEWLPKAIQVLQGMCSAWRQENLRASVAKHIRDYTFARGEDLIDAQRERDLYIAQSALGLEKVKGFLDEAAYQKRSSNVAGYLLRDFDNSLTGNHQEEQSCFFKPIKSSAEVEAYVQKRKAWREAWYAEQYAKHERLNNQSVAVSVEYEPVYDNQFVNSERGGRRVGGKRISFGNVVFDDNGVGRYLTAEDFDAFNQAWDEAEKRWQQNQQESNR